MRRNKLLLFIIVCALAGIATLLGSILGRLFGHSGLNAGATIGGVVGVVAATRIAVRRNILGPKQFWGATIGGILGFALAAVIAVNNLHTPIVPVASILLIGLGAVMGAGTRRKN